MNVLRLAPVLISTLFLAAHFFRARDFPLLALAVGVAVILGVVALFTMCSGLVFRLPRLKEGYGA